MTTQFGILFFVVLLAPTTLVAGVQMQNVALNKNTDQSSGNDAHRAVDGVKYTELHRNSCSLTDEEDNPWWRVDLGETKKIFSLIITSSNQGHYRLNGIQIWIENSPEDQSFRCGVISSFHPGLSKYLSCNNAEGRYVKMFLPGVNKTLSLCEVQVFTADYTPPRSNVAVRGEAVQSSTLSYGGAFRANDGKRHTYYTEGSCSHTAVNDTDPWWRLDLGQTYRISAVKITNRGDCCPERLNGAQIRIGNSLANNGNNNTWCTTINHIPRGNTLSFNCNSGFLEGRFVNVVIPGHNKTLTLCEVEVYGSPKVTVKLLDQVSYWKPTSQISTWGHYVHHIWFHSDASKAVQTCETHYFNNHCCSQTYVEHKPWWMVDLGSEHAVTAVVIHNRGDVRQNLIGAKIKIGTYSDYRYNSKCATISTSALKQTFYCFEMVGRYVSVNNYYINHTSLSLCRVEVYGSRVGPKAASPTTTPTPSILSTTPYPNETAVVGGRTVILMGQKLCWSDAVFYCRHHYWDLLSIHSKEEQALVEELLQNSPFDVTDNVWLGLRRELSSMRWFWMSGDAVTYAKWRMYPVMFPNTCGAMEWDSGLWRPLSCGEPSHFLCQTDPGLSTTKVYYYSTKVNIG